MRKVKHFRGGYRFGTFEGSPTGQIENLTRIPRVSISLVQGADGPVRPKVQVGDRVLRGQAIALDPEDRYSPIHSSITGMVTNIGPTKDDSPDTKPYILITPDSSDEKASYPAMGEGFRKQKAKEVSRILFEAGVTSMIPSGIPTAMNTRGVEPGNIEFLIVTGLDTGVLAPSLPDLLQNRVKDLVLGTQILAYALGVDNTYIGVDSRESRLAIEIAERLDTKSNVEIVGFDPIYPQHFDEIMVETLTEKIVPDNGRAIDVGVVCVDVNTALAAYDAVVAGQPVLDQLLVLAGSGYAKPGFVKAPIGMLLEDIVRPRLHPGQEVRIVTGGLLTGRAVDPKVETVTRGLRRVDAVVENRERVILAFLRPGADNDGGGRTFLSKWIKSKKLNNDTNLHGEDRPCICCNLCDEVCPRDLMPYWLSHHVLADLAIEAMEFSLTSCIECGLCSYICPSKISIMENIKKGKKTLAEELAHA